MCRADGSHFWQRCRVILQHLTGAPADGLRNPERPRAQRRARRHPQPPWYGSAPSGFSSRTAEEFGSEPGLGFRSSLPQRCVTWLSCPHLLVWRRLPRASLAASQSRLALVPRRPWSHPEAPRPEGEGGLFISGSLGLQVELGLLW